MALLVWKAIGVTAGELQSSEGNHERSEEQKNKNQTPRAIGRVLIHVFQAFVLLCFCSFVLLVFRF
jgi:hypothetical protein